MPRGSTSWSERVRSKRLAGPLTVAAVLGLVVAGLSWATYRYSPRLTVRNYTVDLDEGLLVLNLPQVPVADGETPTTEFVLFRRGEHGWEAGEAAHMFWRRVPEVPPFADTSAMVAGFGYWQGAWQSPARPGEFLVLMVPLWAVGLVVYLVYLAFHARWLRLSLRTLMLLTAVIAVGLWWLTHWA